MKRPVPSVEARVSRMLREHGADSPEYRAERFKWMNPSRRLPLAMQRDLDASARQRNQRETPARTTRGRSR